jgi:cell wall-associated NlpC family hydrolase
VDEIGARAFAAARGMIGARFRPQGCDTATGLDCVGLVWAAYAAAGRRLPRPRAYPLRGWSEARIVAALQTAGFARDKSRVAMGDVALIALPARQFHLGLLGGETMVHAHAGLRRVVETPLDDAARTAARWRLD